MKEFVTAIKEVVEDDEREKRIKALIAADPTLTREQAEAQDAEANEPFVEFSLDGRAMKAYFPTAGQLTFLMATLGRGQTDDQRFASIINIMLECLRAGDKDYMESRLLTRDPKQMMDVQQVEEIFAYLVEEWFARPTE